MSLLRKKFGFWVFCWCVGIILTGLLLHKNIFQTTNLDTYYFNTAKGYVENPVLARISYNKLTFYLNRYLTNFFAGTDPNYFFFGGHPREVPGGNNQMKISYWLLPFFLLGFRDLLLNKESKIAMLYGITLFLAAWFAMDTLWWLVVPFWYLVVIYPLRDLWKK